MASLQTAYIDTFTKQDPDTGNELVFAQRYAADNSKIDGPTQVTSDSISATVDSTMLLSNGGFVVTYEYRDPDSDPGNIFAATFLATHEFGPTNADLGTNILAQSVYPDAARYQSIALSGGAYAYVLETYTASGDAFSDTKTFGYVDATGKVTQSPLDYTESLGSGPGTTQGPATLQHLSDGTFTVSGVDTDYDADGMTTGTQTYKRLYSDAGKLLFSSSIDTSTDARDIYQQVSGKPYASEEVFTIKGKLQGLMRYYADGSLALSYTVNIDGSGMTTTTSYTSGGARTTVNADASGHVLSVYGYDANNVLILSDVRKADGTRIVQKPGETINYAADGSRQDLTYAALGSPYQTQLSFYDPTGKLTRTDRYYGDGSLEFRNVFNADGSSSVQNFDTSHRRTTTLAIAANGTKEAVVRTYAGAATTPATVEDDVFGADGKIRSSDLQSADGSHKQTAYVANFSLTSHAGVPDTFKGSPAGADTFVFNAGFGQDLVTNFRTGAAHNTIQFDTAAVPDFMHLKNDITQTDAGALITIGPKDSLLLKGVSAASLTSADFTFKASAGAHA